MQMDRTADKLRILGVDVDVSVGPPTDDQIEQADIVHLFNLQTPDFTLDQLQRAKQEHKKTALSTIWWDFAADSVLQSSHKWRTLRNILGTNFVRPILRVRMEKVLFEERRKHRTILQEADLLLPNSLSEADQLAKLTTTRAKVAVVFNGVDTEGSADDNTAEGLLAIHGLVDAPYILIAGRVEPVKNQLAYILATKPFGLPIVLAGALTQPYADQCKAAGAILLDRQSPETTRALYRRAALHALPSLRETPGLASLEAAAQGTRILSTDVGSAKDYFGELATYCDPHSAQSMRTQTRNALANKPDPHLAEHVKQFTWQRAAQQTLDAYNSL